MNSLTKIDITEKDGVLVVDSRLIAGELNIEHHTLIKTLNKYIDRIESRFGVVRFEVDKPLEGSSGGRPEKYALLTEPQATVLMTFSRNNDQVVDCKLKLVEAFEKAKEVIKTVIPQQSERIRELELALALAQAETQKMLAEKAVLDTRHLITKTCPEPVQQKIFGYQYIDRTEYRDRIIYNDQVIRDGSTITKTELCDRYGFKTRNGKPDYQKLKRHLESLNIPEYAWDEVPSILENRELKRDYLPVLDKKMMDDSRQLWFGE